MFAAAICSSICHATGASASVFSPVLPESSGAGWPSLSGSAHSGQPGTPVNVTASARAGITATVTSTRRTTSVPHLELNLAPTAEDMPDMAVALIRAIIAAAGKDQDEMTVLLVHGEPAAVIAPYGHERRPGAAAEIRFDQTAPPDARLVLTDTWGGSIRMSAG